MSGDQIVAKLEVTHLAYRPDIDGLRAFAVLVVILFHLGFSRLEGGFLGVDVFFVISGFLITGIIQPRMAAGSFSFARFYLRRFRRLLPPAIATVAATFVASAFILMPNDFLAFARSAIASVFSVSNFLFFAEAGYWDTASELKPLLHTWSLGVEEQFYLFWPAAVAGLVALKVHRFAVVFVALTLIGLVLSEWMLRANPSAAFYLLPARVFEFSLGAAVLFISRGTLWRGLASPALRTALFALGMVGLSACVLLYTGETPFPGWRGFLPCGLTGMVLLAGAPTTDGDKSVPRLQSLVLENPVAVWLGRVSYSAYLAHWPVVALMRYQYGLELSPGQQAVAAVIILLATCALHYGIERPLSSRAGMGAKSNSSRAKVSSPETAPAPKLAPGLKRSTLRTVAAGLAVSAVAAHASFTEGWTWRFDDLGITPEQIEAGMSDRFENYNKACWIDDYPGGARCPSETARRILVMGNSHEPDAYHFLRAASEGRDVEFVVFGTDRACKLEKLDNGDWAAEGGRLCAKRFEKLMDSEIMQDMDAIAYIALEPFASNKGTFLDILQTAASKSPDIQVIVFGGYIRTKAPCARIINETGRAQSCTISDNVLSYPRQSSVEPLRERYLSLADILIERGDVLCGEEVPDSCLSQTEDGTPLMFDEHHLSRPFSEMAGRIFAETRPDLMAEIFPEN